LDEQIERLAHCRGREPHVRGCWVVDLVLGEGVSLARDQRILEGVFAGVATPAMAGSRG
jgi:hypothetical protein